MSRTEPPFASAPRTGGTRATAMPSPPLSHSHRPHTSRSVGATAPATSGHARAVDTVSSAMHPPPSSSSVHRTSSPAAGGGVGSDRGSARPRSQQQQRQHQTVHSYQPQQTQTQSYARPPTHGDATAALQRRALRDDPRNQAGSTFESNIVVPRTAPSGGHYETSSALTWAANKAEAEDEWFFLTKLHLEWKETQPERNELYSKVRSMLQPKRSFEYYQGAYNMLIALMPVLSTIHQPNGPFRGHEEEAVQEVMQLVVGDTVGRMLDKWPADWIPKITDHGKPRATRRDQAAAWHRSRYADADADTGNGDDNSDNTNESDTDLVENEEGGGNEDR